MNGIDADGVLVSSRLVSTPTTVVAPAVGYNWPGSVGAVAGVVFTSAGRNTGTYVAPQIALAMAF
ncbi:MAG: hypothetical protein ABI114_08720 [Rhodanobacter sp.]